MNFRPLQLAMLSGALLTPLSCTSVFAQTQTATKKQGKPFLHALFSDNCVLQRDRVIPVWGWTTPRQPVTVKLDEKSISAVADDSGCWVARIGPFAVSGPHTLRVIGARPAENITRQNLLFGDVWLCFGQSNMEMGIGAVNNAKAEIAAANYPQIRLFTVPKLVDSSPVDNVDSQWLECNSSNITKGV